MLFYFLRISRKYLLRNNKVMLFFRVLFICVVLRLAVVEAVAQNRVLGSTSTIQSFSAMQMELLSTPQGLSSRQLTAGLCDRYGYLWFGTQNGLNCWDGVRMAVFSTDADDSLSLPDQTINYLFERSNGELWIATNNGLARYNRSSQTFTRLLAGKPILDIAEDSRGVLWLWSRGVGAASDEIIAVRTSTGSGFAVQQFTASVKNTTPSTFVTRSAAVQPAGQSGGGLGARVSGLRSAFVYCFYEDVQKTLWVGTANGLYRFDAEQQVFVGYLVDETATTVARSPRSHVQSIAETADGTLWIGTNAGLGAITDRRRGTLRWSHDGAAHQAAHTDQAFLSSGVVLLHTDKRRGTLWAASIQAGTVANQMRFVQVHSLSKQSSRSLITQTVPVVLLAGRTQAHRCIARNDNLWWAVGNGVVKLNTSSAELVLVTDDAQRPTRINAPVVDVVVDKEERLWFVRTNVGAESPALPSASFAHIPVAGAVGSGVLSPSVSGLCQSRDGLVWIGYSNGAGLTSYNPISSTMTHYMPDSTRSSSISGFNGEVTVKAFLEDAHGRLWAGSHILERYEALSKTFKHFPLPSATLRSLTSLAQTQDGLVWIGTNAGLYAFDTMQEKFQVFVHNPAQPSSLGNNAINVVLTDKARRQMLWIGHEAGLDYFDVASKRCIHFFSPRGVPSQDLSLGEAENIATTSSSTILTSGGVTCLLEDSKNRLWVGTRGGLSCIDKKQGAVVARYRYEQGKQGLPNASICGLLEDKHGALWISTRRGLVRFLPEQQVFRVFGAGDGLAETEFLERSACISSDGKMWFGSVNGVIVFHPDSIRSRPPIVAPILTGVKKDGFSVWTERFLEDTESIEFEHGIKTVSFEYAALNYSDAAGHRYAYKLEGFDNDWQYVGGLREARYTSLSAGTYRFRVRAANNDGVWSERISSLQIVVHPAWWQTWWFLGSAVLGVSVAVWFLIRLRFVVVQRRNEELEKVVAERTQALKDSNGELDRTLAELKHTQAQLVQSERINAAGMLTAGVMHEINNPNASLASALELSQQQLGRIKDYFLSLLDESDHQRAEVQRFIEMLRSVGNMLSVALNGSERIAHIVSALQGFTKHQYDGSTCNVVAEEVHSTVVMFQYQFKNVDVEEDVSPALKIQGFWAELNQALLNLLVNAAQAGATHIRVTAEERAAEESIVLHVADNGSGMSEETQGKIFEPFFTTKGVGNSGLGLSITYKIIEKQGGRIRVKSILGQGTTFSVILPKTITSRF
jgi:signal transduction histidine kinase/ligand-binding sensor domain-containing protein